MSKLKSDKPPALLKDVLGRKKLADEISNALLAYTKKQKDALTLSITGEWGSGKSTLLSFIKQNLEDRETNPFKVIEFNPWMFYKNESIKEAFLIHLALSLKDFDTKTIHITEKINDFVKAFRWLKYINSTAGNIQEGIENLFEHTSQKQNVHEIKIAIEEILRKSKKKILVLIDDIDRLLPDQITEVLQLISLVTNFSNIIYIVAFDRQIVIDSISKNYNGKGLKYLEKVIQVDYEIPAILDEKLEELFLITINELHKDYAVNFDSYALKSLWGYHGLKEYFKSIRDFNRFFNSLSFRLPAISDDINPADFLAIEAIRIFDYESYSDFYKFYKTNARKRELPDTGLNEEQFKELSSPASEIIKALSNHSTLHQYRKEGNSKRLLDPAYFERYFSLLRSGADISEKDLRDLISRKSVRNGVLREALQFNRVENLITRLNGKTIHETYPAIDYSLINDLITFFHYNSNVFEQYCDKVSDMLINLICGGKDGKNLIQKFFQSFGDNISHPSVVHVYFFHYIRIFLKDGRSFRNAYTAFDSYYKNNFEYIESKYISYFKNESSFFLEQKQTSDCPFIKYLYQINYADLFPGLYNDFQSKLFLDKEYLLYLVSQFISLEEGSVNVRRYDWSYKDILFPGDSFLKFFTLIRNIEPETLTEKNKALRNHLLALDISNYPDIKYPAGTNLLK